MRLGKLMKKILLMYLKRGAMTVPDVASYIDYKPRKATESFYLGYDFKPHLKSHRASSYFRALKTLRKNKLICRKWRLKYTHHEYNPYYMKGRYFYRGWYGKKRMSNGFSLFGLTKKGRETALKIRTELEEFKKEWEKFL